MVRVIRKQIPEAPHQILLVLDASNGQNAIFQTREFLEATELTGLVITKLDGTSKGGVIIGIVNEFDVPVRYIGCLLYTSPSPRDRTRSRMPSSA